MNYLFLILGILAIIYGVFTFIVRAKNPERLVKLTAMKEKMGNRQGTIIHTLFYSIVPILFGLILIISEIIKLRAN